MNIWTYIRRYFSPGEWALALAAAAVAGALPAVTIRLRGDIIDGASVGADSGFLPRLALFGALSLLGMVCGAVLTRLTERHRIRQAARLDALRLEKAAKVAFTVTETERFHALWQKSASASELDSKLFTASGELARLSVRLALSLLVLWTVDVWTAVGIALLLTAGVLLNRNLAQKTEGFWAKYIENMRRTNYFSSLLMQREYAAERKLFSFDDEIDRRHRESFDRAKRENARLGRGRFQLETLMQLLFAFYSVAVVLLLLRPLTAGKITIGLFTSAFYAAEGLVQSCGQICAAVFELEGSARQMSGFADFLALEEESTEAVSGEAGGSKGIEFRDVTFTYPGAAKPVLQNVSFRLEPGRHYALVGENGCGKSTLVKLLAGLYAPDSGQVLINGEPVRSLTPAKRRSVFSVVFQDFYRYPLTIRENVSLCLDAPASDGVLDKVFGQIGFRPMAAAREAGYDSDLMPLYKTGAGLSGGEWQKLTVARCVLSPAPVAVLDEPNAALDPVAEAAVYQAYRGLLAERTTLFISHRLGSVRMSDEILVLKDGALIAKAPHGELMRDCSYYAELFNTQKGLYDEE